MKNSIKIADILLKKKIVKLKTLDRMLAQGYKVIGTNLMIICHGDSLPDQPYPLNKLNDIMGKQVTITGRLDNYPQFLTIHEDTFAFYSDMFEINEFKIKYGKYE